jgi:molybdopterin/thiamine biosynthesis adenylyltransferase
VSTRQPSRRLRIRLGDRYARQDLAGWSQRRLARAMAVVVGAGAVGNEVIKTFALVGVGRIVVIDFDHVSPSNLTRCVLLRDHDVGRPKAEAVSARVHMLNPDVRVLPVVGDIEFDLGDGYLEDAEVIVSCVDNLGARFVLNRRARALGRSWFDGAISADAIQVSAYHPAGPCYACGLGESARQRLAMRHSCTGFRRVTTASPVPTTAVTSSLCGGLLAHLAIEAIHGRTPAHGSRWTMMLATPRLLVDRLTVSAQCPYHPKRVRRREATLDVGPEVTWQEVHRLLGLSPTARLVPPEGLAAALSCVTCGLDQPRLFRWAQLPVQLAVCLGCGAQATPRLAKAIPPGTPLARVPLRDLGFVSGSRLTILDGRRSRVFGLGMSGAWHDGRQEVWN